jgi:hypothetical protein
MLSTHDKLLHAVTEYDRRQSTRKGYNRWALPQYLGAINESIMPDIENGASLRQALVSHLNGRLLDVCLKAVGEPPSTREEQR